MITSINRNHKWSVMIANHSDWQQKIKLVWMTSSVTKKDWHSSTYTVNHEWQSQKLTFITNRAGALLRFVKFQKKNSTAFAFERRIFESGKCWADRPEYVVARCGLGPQEERPRIENMPTTNCTCRARFPGPKSTHVCPPFPVQTLVPPTNYSGSSDPTDRFQRARRQRP